jgi:radical SAM superfamily enzyme YgiQ (UPF0313 family)
VRILLIYPEPDTSPYYLQIPTSCLSLAASLEGKHQVQFYDQNVDEQPVEKIVSEFSPAVIIVVFSMRCLSAAYRVLQEFRQKNYVMIASGTYPAYRPKECLKTGFDIVLQGNVENTLSDFLNHLTPQSPHVDQSLHQPIGYHFKDSTGHFIDTGISRSLSASPYVQSRYLIPKKYHQRYTHGFLVGSKGCHYACTFCISAETGYKVREPKQVVDELEYIVNTEGHHAIHFGDDIFTHDPDWVIAICRDIIKRDIKCNWSVNSRNDIPKRHWHMFDWMSKAGCKIIAFGIESAEQSILKNIRKGLKC